MKTAVVAYIPVVHAGYTSFLGEFADRCNKIKEQKIKKHTIDTQKIDTHTTLFLIDPTLFPENRALVKDLRALSPEIVKSQLQVIFPRLQIQVMQPSSLLVEELASFDQIVMPDEQINHDLLERYFYDQTEIKLNKKDIHFRPIFLRWDAKKSQSRKDVHPAGKISTLEFDTQVMKQAFAAATTSLDWWRQVGAALVVQEKNAPKIALIARNTHLPYDQQPYIDGDPRADFSSGVCIEAASSIHAEAQLVAMAAKQGICMNGAWVYVTTFPCPVCARLLAKTGISRLYYAQGYSLIKGQEVLEHEGIELIQVVAEDL